MPKELLGYCAVDSGQLIVVDPCYLKEWKHGKNDELDNHYGLACLATCLKAQGGEILVAGIAGTGVAFSSGWGDGSRYDSFGEPALIQSPGRIPACFSCRKRQQTPRFLTVGP